MYRMNDGPSGPKFYNPALRCEGVFLGRPEVILTRTVAGPFFIKRTDLFIFGRRINPREHFAVFRRLANELA